MRWFSAILGVCMTVVERTDEYDAVCLCVSVSVSLCVRLCVCMCECVNVLVLVVDGYLSRFRRWSVSLAPVIGMRKNCAGCRCSGGNKICSGMCWPGTVFIIYFFVAFHLMFLGAAVRAKDERIFFFLLACLPRQ